MLELIRGLASTQDGLFTAAQASSAGVTDKVLRRAVKDGTCIRLRHGVYVFADLYPEHPDERHRLLAASVLATHAGRIALSHHSGALAQDLPTWGVPYSRVRGVRVAGSHTDASSGLALGRHWPEDAYTTTESGDPVLIPAVCGLQIAMTFGVEQAVVTLDAALARRLTTPDELADWLDRLGGHRFVTRARRAVDLADGRSESPGESRLRVRLHVLGYVDLEPQVWIRSAGRVVGRVDLYDRARRVVVEFDGKVKYQGAAASEAVFAEKVREDELRRLGLGVARYSWSDLDSYETLRRHVERAARSATDLSVSYGEPA